MDAQSVVMPEAANILLVDDQPARLLTYEAILGDLGHVLVKAGSGRDALRCLMDADFAAILLDVSMPDMDGFETAALIREHPRFESTPITFVTAVHMTDMDQLRGYRIGAVDYVYVPVVPEILRGKVQVLVDLYMHRRELQRLNRTLESANAELHEAHSRLRDENTRELAKLNRTLEAANAELESRNALLCSEVREREAAQHALLDAAERKDQFLAMLAHELRNPLSAVHNAVQVIRIQARNDPQMLSMSELLGRQVNHLARLVDDLLDVSRVSTGRVRLRKAQVDLIDVVRQAIEMSQPAVHQRAQTLIWSPPDQPIPVEGDAARLIQVVDNLLRNASQYTEAGGEIAISLNAEATRADAGLAVLRVRDNGIGIAASMLDQVFELFSQVTPSYAQSRSGLGVGLSLVRALVQMHGGTVVAQSDGPGKGAEFIVRIPLHAEAAARPALARAGEPATPPRRGLRLLVVDDNADSVDALGMWLRIEGHEVEIAYTGEQALARALVRPPDVVVLDLALPGMNGYEVASRLVAETSFARVCFIAMTGFGADADRERSRQAGFHHHLVKPIDYEAFAGVLARIKADDLPHNAVAGESRPAPATWPLRATG
jgi:signal transduction histidine kinase/ActR/RegA family two-component response regulator